MSVQQIEIRGPINQYFDQLFQFPPVILGRQLLPLSIGRYRLMAWMDCAFCAEEERIATARDLLIGIVICSLRCDEFRSAMRERGFIKKVERWGQKVGLLQPTLNRRPVLYLCRRIWPTLDDALDLENVNTAMAQFQEYIVKGQQAPEYWDETEDAKSSAAHWSHNIEVVLCGNLNWNEEQINEAPLGKALADYFKFMENQGMISLMTKDEIVDLHREISPEEKARQKSAAEAILDWQTNRNN